MRSKIEFCAIVSLLAGLTVTELVAQAPAAPNDDRLRDALRQKLEAGNDAAKPVVAQPVQPAPTVLPVAPTSFQAKRPLSVAGTNLPLSLRDAVWMALDHNLELQVFRYTPVISEYDRRSLYGVYDPLFSSGISRSEINREPGGINLNTGNTQPGTVSRTDSVNAGLEGYLPTGLRYGFTHDINNNKVTAPFQIGTNSFGDPVFGTRKSDTWNTRAAFTGTQPLLRDSWIDAERLNIKIARRDVRISDLVFERQLMDVVSRVEIAYYNLVAAREAVRVSESDVAVKKQFYEEQQQRVKVGTLAPLDEKLAQAELARSESSLIEFRRLASETEAILKGLIHEDFASRLDVRIEPTDRMMAVPSTLDVFDAFREAMEKRPDLQQARLELEKADIRTKYTFNQLFPRLDLVGTLGYNGLDLTTGGALGDVSDRRFEDWQVGLALSFPLTLTGERNAHKSSKARRAQLVVEYKRQEQVVEQEIDSSVRRIRTLWAQIPFTREVTQAQQAALDAERRKLDAGKSTSFSVLSIASDVTIAQVEEIRAVLSYNQALAELAFRKGTTLERWKIDRPVRANQ